MWQTGQTEQAWYFPDKHSIQENLEELQISFVILSIIWPAVNQFAYIHMLVQIRLTPFMKPTVCVFTHCYTELKVQSTFMESPLASDYQHNAIQNTKYGSTLALYATNTMVPSGVYVCIRNIYIYIHTHLTAQTSAVTQSKSNFAGNLKHHLQTNQLEFASVQSYPLYYKALFSLCIVTKLLPKRHSGKGKPFSWLERGQIFEKHTWMQDTTSQVKYSMADGQMRLAYVYCFTVSIRCILAIGYFEALVLYGNVISPLHFSCLDLLDKGGISPQLDTDLISEIKEKLFYKL